MSSFAGPSRSRLSAAEDGQAIPLLRTGGHYVLNTPPPPRPLSAHDKKLLVRVLHDVEFRFHRRKHRFPWVCCFTVIVLLLFSFVILLLYGRVHFSGALTGTGGAVEDIVGGGLSCGSCLTALAPLKALAEKGEASFADAFVGVCTDFKIQKSDVCEGSVSTQGAILAHALRSISLDSWGATRFCSVVFGMCANEEVIMYHVPMSDPPVNPKKWERKGNDPFQVIHFSDAHIERDYVVGSEADCGRPICCTEGSNIETGLITSPAPQYGTGNCDAPPDLFATMLDSMKTIAPNASFTIFTGDLVDGDVWSDTVDSVKGDISSFFSEWDHGPIWSTLGNHDTSPVNSFPRPEDATTNPDNSSQWAYDAFAATAPWDESTARAQQAGCYSKVIDGTELRIISVNSNFWYTRNLWLLDSDYVDVDPGGVIAYLVSELQATEDAGQRAWIIAHMPFGASDSVRQTSNEVDQVLQRFANTIAGVFVGHTHQDSFQIGYSDNENKTETSANVIAYNAPGSTPRGARASWRYYHVDPDTYEVMDIFTYTGDTGGLAPGVAPTWQLYYSAREYAQFFEWDEQAPLNAQFYHRLSEVMLGNDTTALDLFNTRSKGGAFGAGDCDQDCREQTVCGLRALRSEDNCLDVKPGIHFKKRDLALADFPPPPACGHSGGVEEIMTKLAAKLTAEEDSRGGRR